MMRKVMLELAPGLALNINKPLVTYFPEWKWIIIDLNTTLMKLFNVGINHDGS